MLPGLFVFGGPFVQATDSAPLALPRPAPRRATPRNYELLASLPFVGVHLAPLVAIWVGVTWEAAVLCFALWAGRMFWVTAGYHRYFSHRSFRTSRIMQFVFAFLCQTSSQRGVLWWA